MFLDCILSALKTCCASIFLLINPNLPAKQPQTEQPLPPVSSVCSGECLNVRRRNPSLSEGSKVSAIQDFDGLGCEGVYDEQDQTFYWGTKDCGVDKSEKIISLLSDKEILTAHKK